MQELLNLFKALSDETRLRILKILEHGELCVCDIVEALNMIQPNVSFHLGILKEAGLIKDRREGRWIHYRIDDSDIFKRILILSVIGKIPAGAVVEDKKKVEGLINSKNSKQGIAGVGRNCKR